MWGEGELLLARVRSAAESATLAWMALEAQQVYSGDRKNGRMEGYGTYKFPSGTTYTGEFVDGEFHGKGTLEYEGAGKYEATWDHGKVIKGRYVFADGLAYTEPQDGHCVPRLSRPASYRALASATAFAGDCAQP